MPEKSGPEMRSYFAELRDSGRVLESCLFCDWQFEGLAAEGRLAALSHRQKKHPEACIRKPRHRGGRIKKQSLRSAGEEAQIRVDAAESNRLRAEREDADRLAKVLRGQARVA